MTSLFIIICILLAVFLNLINKKKAAFFILLVVLLSYFIVGSGLIASLLLTQLQAPFISNQNIHWKDKNVIVLLGGGTVKLPAGNGVKPTILAYSRITQAAQLYFDCIKSTSKCLIIISGGDARHTGVTETSLYRNLLETLGVSTQDMQLETKSLNTFRNAEFTSALLKHIPYNEVVLVTSGYHMKRALLYFSYFGVNAKSIPSDYVRPLFVVIPSSYNFVLTDLALHEYTGIIRFYIYNFLGWNKK